MSKQKVMVQPMKLIFVYNANSGVLNALVDAVHKMVSPETYSCELCALTYGAVGERKAWRQYRKRSAHEMVFLHKDEFEEGYGQRFTYPLVLCDDDGRLTPLITKRDFQEMDTLDELLDWLRPLDEEPVASCQPAVELVASVT